MAAERDDENVEFRTFLKQLDISSKELDALVHQINADVSAQIDCTKCANCCKQVKPVLNQADVSTFAAGLRRPASELEQEFLTLIEANPPEHQFNQLPCPFLQDDRCSNYDDRPQDCRSYPHLHKDGFVHRLWGVVENYSICPIIFNVYERLKADLWHHDGLDDDELFYDNL